jgi:uncharacterized membrane protein YraQ (UPF0718 family)
MSSLLQADIFFFVTTIAVIVLLIIAVVIGYFIFKIVQHAEYIAKKIRDESDTISDDIAYMRANIKEKVSHAEFGLSGIFRTVSSMFSWTQSKAKESRKIKSRPVKTSKESFDDEG